MAVGLVGGEGAEPGDALDVFEAGGDEFVGAVFDPLGSGGVGGAARGWVVFEATVLRRVVGGGDDDAVGAVELGVLVVGEDGVGEGGGGGVAEMLVDDGLDVVGGEDFEGGGEGGLGEGVGVFGEEEWAECVLGGAVLDDGLGDGGDVVVVEGGLEGAAAVAGGAEGYALGWDCGVGVEGVESGDEARDVDEGFGKRQLAGLVGRFGAHASVLVS